jgi:MoaA/NifB/PqqE/SkfB family radical SAM enzyme
MVRQKAWGAIILKPGCLNECVFCGRVPKPNALEMKEQEMKVAKNIIEFRANKIENIEISGNDPLEYPRIIPLVAYIKKMGFKNIQLSTHGRQLANERLLGSLIKAGVNKFRIPLYGSRAAIHDSVTQAIGSYKETLKGIKLLMDRTAMADLQVSFLVMRQNSEDVLGVLKLVKKLKIKDFYIAYPFLAKPDDHNFYIPLKDIGKYLKKAYSYAQKIKLPVKFFEIPFCVFGFYNENISNNSLPPDLGKNCQPDEIHKTKIKDMPAYRLKKKAAICKRCSMSGICDGFPLNDTNNFGLNGLKPIEYEK